MNHACILAVTAASVVHALTASTFGAELSEDLRAATDIIHDGNDVHLTLRNLYQRYSRSTSGVLFNELPSKWSGAKSKMATDRSLVDIIIEEKESRDVNDWQSIYLRFWRGAENSVGSVEAAATLTTKAKWMFLRASVDKGKQPLLASILDSVDVTKRARGYPYLARWTITFGQLRDNASNVIASGYSIDVVFGNSAAANTKRKTIGYRAASGLDSVMVLPDERREPTGERFASGVFSERSAIGTKGAAASVVYWDYAIEGPTTKSR
jgi:hypothetical protein